MSDRSGKHVLLVAFQFPPLQGSSGVHRIVSLAKHLPKFNWRVSVLTVEPRAYVRTAQVNAAEFPTSVQVYRCVALDARRHLSIFGRYPGFLSVPDRWKSWMWSGIAKGKRIIKEDRPDVILSSFPIATANMIAAKLASMSGIPWVADLRDPIVTESHPPPGILRDQYQRLEQQTFKLASRVIVTTDGAASLYRSRYPRLSETYIHVVGNGFDEDLFDKIGGESQREGVRGRLRILHSGLVYEEARNPVVLFDCLADLILRGVVRDDEVEILFRASNQEQYIRWQAGRFGLEEVVRCQGAIDHSEAIAEMAASDSLLLLQSAACNDQIPAKVYEYLRCRRPILGIVDPAGATGRLLRSLGIRHVAALEDRAAVLETLEVHIRAVRSGEVELPPFDRVLQFSRHDRAREYAARLGEVSEPDQRLG